MVSVIIPIWGTAYNEFIPECLESIYNQTYTDIEVIISGGCTDLPSARNAGIRYSKGEYILCLDADDLITPDYVEKCLNIGYDIVGGGIKQFGDVNNYTYIDQTGDFSEYNKMHCSALYRREVWEVIGGYDESMKIGYEDWDFYYRASKAGFTFHMINEPLFLYRRHGKTMVHEASRKHNQLRHYIVSKYAI